jgi:polyhydroxyalkanoate synthesis regulator phasin
MSSISMIEYSTLLARLEAVENRLERIETALHQLVSMDQVTALGLIRQTEISDLTTRVSALEQQVTALEQYHRS